MPIELTITLISIAAAAIGANFGLLWKLSRDHAAAYANLATDHATLGATLEGISKRIDSIDNRLNSMQQNPHGAPQPQLTTAEPGD